MIARPFLLWRLPATGWYCWVTRLQVAGPWRVPGLLLSHWWVWPFPDMAACGARGPSSWCCPAGEWGLILGQLAEGSKVSQSWFWPAGSGFGWCWGPGVPRTSSNSQMCGAGFSVLSLQVSGGLRAGVVLLVNKAGAHSVPGQVPTRWCVGCVLVLEVTWLW